MDLDMALDLTLEFEGSDLEDDATGSTGAEALGGPSRDSTVSSEKARGKPSKSWYCPVCHKRVGQRLRRHAEREHVPWWLTPNRACWSCYGTAQSATFKTYRHEACQENMTDKDIERYTELCNGVLEVLKSELNCQTYEEVLDKVTSKRWYPVDLTPTMLSFQQKLFIWLWERENKRALTPFAEMKISPPTSVGCLLHFKVLLCILPHLSEEARNRIVLGNERVKGTAQHIRRPIHTIDGHTHLDGIRGLREYEGDRWGSFLRCQFFIANFVFPRRWDSFSDWMMNPRVYGTVGIHPTVCQEDLLVVQGHLTTLRQMLNHPRCVGLGEVGLDYFRGRRSAHRLHQRENLKSLLQLRPVGKPIIIHCRDGSDSSNAYQDLFDIFSSLVSPTTTLVFHSFSAGPAERDLFSQYYKEIYFSIGPKCLTMSSGQQEELRSALRGLQLDRIMVETDFPYQTKDARNAMLQVAGWVGQVKGVCPTVLLEANRRNCLRCFKIPVNPSLGI
jgi:Tat protein secretion system quality control protein TatD with DNase activity